MNFRNKVSLFYTTVLNSRENFLFTPHVTVFYNFHYKHQFLKECTHFNVLLCFIIKCHAFNSIT